MHYRNLGRTGLKVSCLTMGTATFGGGPGISLGDTGVTGAARQIDMCLDAGVNLIDTADIYGEGRSEEITGEVLAEGRRRERMLIATKARGGMGEGPNDRGLSRHHLIAACEASLKRLKTDHIDLYQMHGWDGQTPIEETMAALDRLVQDGKVRYIGCSNFSGWHIAAARAAATAGGGEMFAAQQICYTLYTREAEYELLPTGEMAGMGTLIFSPTNGGLLTGKFRRDSRPEQSRWLEGWNEPPNVDEDRLHTIVDEIVAVADELGVSGARVAIAWLLTRHTVSSVIIGGRTDAQIADNLAAADLQLAPDQIARLERISRPPLIYPYWHQYLNAKDRLGPADLMFLEPYLKDDD